MGVDLLTSNFRSWTRCGLSSPTAIGLPNHSDALSTDLANLPHCLGPETHLVFLEMSRGVTLRRLDPINAVSIQRSRSADSETPWW
jgi:hypothetical protein